MKDKISDIFFYIDEFCIEYYKLMEGSQLPEETNKRARNQNRLKKFPDKQSYLLLYWLIIYFVQVE